MTEVTHKSVTDWVWEKNTVGRTVPRMPPEEQALYLELDQKKRAGEFIPKEKFTLYTALRKKWEYRQKRNVDTRPVDWGARTLERKRRKYGRT